jgi:cytochrome c biogenesis protein CcmG/thiol:disulfide interchange protein DsbE
MSVKPVAKALTVAAPQKKPPQKINGFRALLFLAALGVGVALVAKKESGPPVGDLAAEFDLPIADSTSRVKLSELRGAPVVVEVFASWCGACRQAAPMLHEAALSKRQSDVHFVGVSVDADPRVAARLKDSWDIPYAVLHDDGSVAAKYRIQVLPTVIVIDADGHVRHVSSGAPRAETLEAWLGEVGAARLSLALP